MIDELKKIEEKFAILSKQIEDPLLLKDQKKYTLLNKEYKKISNIVEQYIVHKTIKKSIEESKLLLQDKDTEIIEMAKKEIADLDKKLVSQEEILKKLLLPPDPYEGKNCILELRAGVGGDEAAIWTGDLFRMYERFAEAKGWRFQVVDYTQGSSGGYKEIISIIAGKKSYASLRYESGVHRVQRVPATESQGRVHTSTASVAVLPEADEVDLTIDKKDIKKETFCSSGPGGQSVNTTYSAVRLTHIPSGIVVSCQDGKSQIKNMEKAQKVLRARLHKKKLAEQNAEIGAERRAMVGSGDRSEKIRTYNYPQGRVTDHRISYTQHNLPAMLQGDLDKLVEKLQIAQNTLGGK